MVRAGGGQHSVGDRDTGTGTELDELGDVGVVPLGVSRAQIAMVRQLEDASAHGAHLADQRIDLGPFRHPRGNRAVVGGLVVIGNGRGEAHSAGAQ